MGLVYPVLELAPRGTLAGFKGLRPFESRSVRHWAKPPQKNEAVRRRRAVFNRLLLFETQLQSYESKS